MFKSLLRDRTGNVAPIFAIACLPIIVTMGSVVDYTNAYRQQAMAQDALDAAALAANRMIGLVPEREVKAEAEAVFRANTDGKIVENLPLEVDIGRGTVEATTELTVPTYFLDIAGIKEHVFQLKSRSVAGAATYEVAMVLDNSGSMSGSKIASLRTAAHDLTRVLHEVNQSNPKPDPVKIALVPFAASVNVGSGYANAGWIDRNAVAPSHFENFDEDVNRFDLFDQLRDVTWQGCVEPRPYPYDVTDDGASPGVPATMFVPMFAVDESDDGYFPNNYLDDDGGACEFSSGGRRGRWGRRGGGGGGPSIDDLTDAQRQELTCKYDGESVGGRDNGVRRGPNYNCTAKPLQPLTTSRATIDNQIDQMQANGMTNIHDGIMWGWRVLSPGSPFTEGRPYLTDDNRKVLIVMTDGMNTYTTYNNFNKSMYGSYGYVSKDHLGTTSSSNNTVHQKMNERTLEACAGVKGTEIYVYTVAFQVNDSDTLDLLRTCATRPDMAFRSESNSQLIAVFQQIAQDISLLRLEK